MCTVKLSIKNQNHTCFMFQLLRKILIVYLLIKFVHWINKLVQKCTFAEDKTED